MSNTLNILGGAIIAISLYVFTFNNLSDSLPIYDDPYPTHEQFVEWHDAHPYSELSEEEWGPLFQHHHLDDYDKP